MIKELLEKSKNQNYIGEEISQYEHAVQCADLAIKAGADEDLIIAAFLHDIGHLVAKGDEFGVENHEDIGAEFLLKSGFSQRTANLVRNHVRAKRYLVATKPSYRDKLSDASVETLRRQGGPMNQEEIKKFEEDPDFKDSLRLRAWDEQGKIKNYKSANEATLFKLIRARTP
jgi:2-amino-1-hydroxyethylphosphonate dioxygenase (glycine-forming)